jgi:hypothetical protein
MSHLVERGVFLTAVECRRLYQAANIGELRKRYRIGDTETYRLLTEISRAAFEVDADGGNLTRQSPANDERETWTVHQIASAAGLAERTVRLDCANGELPATKQGNTWTVTTAEAQTYISRRRRK